MALVMILLPFLTGVPGCSENGPTQDADIQDPVLPASTRLVETFYGALENYDLATLSTLLHDDFQMPALPSTLAKWEDSQNPYTTEVFDRLQTLNMLTNIFSGQGGVDWNEAIVPPLASIVVQVMDQAGPWELVEQNTEYFGDYPGAQQARYSAYYQFKYPGSFWFEIIQELDFYIVPAAENQFSLLGIVPQEVSEKSVTDVLSLEDMLSLYR